MSMDQDGQGGQGEVGWLVLGYLRFGWLHASLVKTKPPHLVSAWDTKRKHT